MTALRRGIWQPTQRQWHGVPFEVDFSHPLARGLMGYWSPRAQQGRTVRDLSRHVADATLSSLVYARDYRGPAFDFTGNAFANCGSRTSLNFPATGATVSIWIRPSSLGNNKCFLGRFTPGWFFRTAATGDASRLNFYSGSTDYITTASLLSVGSWTLGVVTYDGDKYRIYANGVLQHESGGGQSAIYNGATALLIGRIPDGFNFPGYIGDTMLYNRALSAQEIRQLYLNPYALLRPKTALRLGKAPAVVPAGNPLLMHMHQYSYRGGTL